MFQQHSRPARSGVPGGTRRSPLGTFLKFSWLGVAAAAIVVGMILFSRWDDARRLEREAAQQKQEADRRDVEAMGGNRFEILHFYASPGRIARGERAQLCYGVSNAKAVRLEPESGAVWPSYNRCLYISPAQDTAYTLTIEDEKGQTKTSSLTLQVR